MLKLLLVEDDPALQFTIQTALEAKGYLVDAVSTTGDALDRLNSGVAYPVVVSDIYVDDGGQKPPKPAELEAGQELEDNGALLIGDKGKLVAGTYGENLHFLPESRMVEYKWPAQTIPRVPKESPHLDFIQAGKAARRLARISTFPALSRKWPCWATWPCVWARKLNGTR